jgi:hypothetical protein
MKTTLTAIVAITLLITLAGFASMQKEPSKVILVRAQYGYGLKPVLQIYRGGVEVENISVGDGKKGNSELAIDRTLETVNNLAKDGFEVIATTESIPTAGYTILTFTLKK